MLRYAKHVPRSEEIVMAPATAQLVQLTISSELARRQHIPVPDMLPAAEIVVEAGRSFTMAAEEEASRLSTECSRQVRSLTKDLDLAGSDLMSVSHALRSDQSVALRTALRDSCFQYNLTVMKILLSLDGQKIKIIKSCGEQLVAEIHSIPHTCGNMKTLVPLFKHFIEDLTQFCYRITDYHKEIKDKTTRATVEQGLKIIKRTPTVISNILQDRARRSVIQTDTQLNENIKTFVTTIRSMLSALNTIDVESATRYLELVLHASIAVAGETSSRRRNAISSICSKIIKIRSELAKLYTVTSQSNQSWNVINQLSNQMGEQFSELNRILSQTYKSSEHNTDQSKPLLNLRTAAQKSYVPNDPELEKYIERFKQHANRLIDITEYAVEVSKEDDENILVLQKIAADISVLGPKIIACALSVHAHPNENVTLAFMNAMCNEWSKVVSRLLALIDNLTNTGEFLRASESHINKDVALSKQAFINQDATALLRAAKAMINKAQRVFHVGQKELLKSTSTTFSSELEAALADLEHVLPRIIALTQATVEEFKDISSQEELATVAHEIARAVHKIKTVVCEEQGDPFTTQADAAKRLASALRGDTGFFDIGVQTYPENISSKENEPPDILLQFAMKDDSLDPDDINKLVGVKGIRKPPASINDAIICLADLITTAMNGEAVESCITVLAAHCGRIKDLSQQCHSLSDNQTRLRTIDFLVKEMNKLTPSVNDAARKTSSNNKNAISIENLRWSARHWADSVIVLGKAFDDFGLGPSSNHQFIKVPSMNGLITAATSGDKDMTEAELDSLSLRTTKQIDLATYCSAACLSSTVAQQIDNTSGELEDVFSEMSRTAIALAECQDDITLSHLEHLCSQWQEHYLQLCTLVADNQPDTLPDETELGIPPSKVNIAIEQLISSAKSGNRPKVQVLGNSLSAMTTKMRRISKPFAESNECLEYQRDYINDVNEELMNITPEVIKYGLLVAADTNDENFRAQLDLYGKEWVDKMISLSNALEMMPDISNNNSREIAMETLENEDIELDAVKVDVCEMGELEDSPAHDLIMKSAPASEKERKPSVNHFPEDLHEPIKAAGYRLVRQGTIKDEGHELKEIKSITTKLCDCLQVLSSTHTDVNERYEMEDTVEQVKGTVNQILLMRPGDLEDSVEDWLESINSVTSHLDIFLKPLLDIVSSPKNKDVFSTATERIIKLVDTVSDITSDLKLAVDINLITNEKERDDVTLVMVTQDHVTKMTPALCDAIHVVSSRPNDTHQRTKFEAIKYQWATKFRLLTIAIGDILGNHCAFPEFPDRKDCWVVSEDMERLLTSVDLISDKINNQEYHELVFKHITKLRDLKDSMSTVHLMDPAQYMQLKLDVTFAVYCLHSAVLSTCSDVTALVPELPSDLVDDSCIEFDPVKLSDSADDAIDMIRMVTERTADDAEDGDQDKVEKMKVLSCSLIETLVLISDQPSTEVLLEYKQSYVDWLCHVMEIAKNQTFDTLNPPDIKVLVDDIIKSDDVIQENGSDMDIPILYHGQESPGNDIRCSTFRSELSGSQTFSELHFSEDEGNKTPEPTFSAPLDERTGNEGGGADYVNLQYDKGELQMGLNKQEPGTEEEDEEEAARLQAGDSGSLHGTDSLFEPNSFLEDGSRSSTPVMMEPLEMEFSEDPTNTAVISDIASVMSDQDPPQKMTGTIDSSIKMLEEELAPWEVENNNLLLTTKILLQQFLLIRDAVYSASNSRAHIELIDTATQITDTTQDISEQITELLPHCSHRSCCTDLEYCANTLPTLSKQLMITCTLVSANSTGSDTEALIGPHVKSMTDCLLKLLHAAYHAHLAGALDEDAVFLRWRSVDDSDDDSVVV